MKILIKAADFVVAFLLTIAASSMIISMFCRLYSGLYSIFASCIDGRAVPLFLYLYCIHRRSVGRETGMHLGVDYFTPNCRNRRVRRAGGNHRSVCFGIFRCDCHCGGAGNTD